jgi:hypothetical protein
MSPVGKKISGGRGGRRRVRGVVTLLGSVQLLQKTQSTTGLLPGTLRRRGEAGGRGGGDARRRWRSGATDLGEKMERRARREGGERRRRSRGTARAPPYPLHLL